MTEPELLLEIRNEEPGIATRHSPYALPRIPPDLDDLAPLDRADDHARNTPESRAPPLRSDTPEPGS